MYLASSSCILPSAPIFNCGIILPSSSTSPNSIDWSSELRKSNYKGIIYIPTTCTFLYLFVYLTV